VVEMLLTQSLGVLCVCVCVCVCVCLVSGSAVINLEGRTNLSCPVCNVYSFTSLFDSTCLLAGCDVSLSGGSWPSRRFYVGLNCLFSSVLAWWNSGLFGLLFVRVL
jgi:hypothetical protein